jgi:hypothetical protein
MAEDTLSKLGMSPISRYFSCKLGFKVLCKAKDIGMESFSGMHGIVR